jgi:hypothetical protein
MKPAVEMGSGAMIYMLGFINFASDIQKLTREGTHTGTLT